MRQAPLGPCGKYCSALENNRRRSFWMVSSQLNNATAQLCCVCSARTAGPKPLAICWQKVVATVANHVLSFSYTVYSRVTLKVKDRFSWLPWLGTCSPPSRIPGVQVSRTISHTAAVRIYCRILVRRPCRNIPSKCVDEVE